jgi:hypothetical protein
VIDNHNNIYFQTRTLTIRTLPRGGLDANTFLTIITHVKTSGIASPLPSRVANHLRKPTDRSIAPGHSPTQSSWSIAYIQLTSNSVPVICIIPGPFTSTYRSLSPTPQTPSRQPAHSASSTSQSAPSTFSSSGGASLPIAHHRLYSSQVLQQCLGYSSSHLKLDSGNSSVCTKTTSYELSVPNRSQIIIIHQEEIDA